MLCRVGTVGRGESSEAGLVNGFEVGTISKILEQ